MTRQIRFNAFDMNCVAHQSSGLWRHSQDRSRDYNTLTYWTELAKLLVVPAMAYVTEHLGFGVTAGTGYLPPGATATRPASTHCSRSSPTRRRRRRAARATDCRPTTGEPSTRSEP